jgi:hypothetical protein
LLDLATDNAFLAILSVLPEPAKRKQLLDVFQDGFANKDIKREILADKFRAKARGMYDVTRIAESIQAKYDWLDANH